MIQSACDMTTVALDAPRMVVQSCMIIGCMILLALYLYFGRLIGSCL